MRRRVVFKARAEKDIDDAFKYLYARSPQVAVGFIEAARRQANAVASLPGLGRVWQHGEPDLPVVRSVRIPGFDAWLMVYTDRRRAIWVLRVIHGARDLDAGLDLGNEISL